MLWNAGDWMGKIKNARYKSPYYPIDKPGRMITITAKHLSLGTPAGRVVMARTPDGCIVDTGMDYVDCGIQGFTLNTKRPRGPGVQWIVVAENVVVHDSLDGRRIPLRRGATYPISGRVQLGIAPEALDKTTTLVLTESLEWFQQYQQYRLQQQLAAQQRQRQYRGW